MELDYDIVNKMMEERYNDIHILKITYRNKINDRVATLLPPKTSPEILVEYRRHGGTLADYEVVRQAYLEKDDYDAEVRNRKLDELGI
jgi:hypothetical protein